jgi:polyisoprenoid-binding protein YceI
MSLVPTRVVVVSAIVLSLGVPIAAAAQTESATVYPLTNAASVDFTIYAKMLFSFKREGHFKELSGELVFDPARPADTKVDLTVYTSSVEMNNKEQEGMLRSGDFFDADHFPTMHFTSAAAALSPDGTYALTGDLTIRGITKRVTVPVRLASTPAGGHALPALETTFQIDRTEFGLNGTPQWGGVNVSIARNVQIHIAVGTTPGPRPFKP